ncbi:hypothetical protein J8L88_05810 [Aquimarina sp. MMG015]|uniref:hypothetical protein n=1 Tax=Aquimarina sp. MMG015 TaxID=2822689 RepID=UPI001B39F66E|nr:hypothetical protein [Aquimarina sp. MMG015]MBQ4802366.1 hypothetical protein [Aquimarina sp. MMG015]
MSDTKKKAYQILVIVTCLVVLFVSFIFLKSRYDTNKAATIIKFKAKKDVIQDLDYQYAKLKYAARSWSTLYAKITAIHNRDTIVYQNYTVADLTKKHHNIISFWDEYEDDVYIKYYATNTEYISNIYPVSDTLKQLFTTYHLHEKISRYQESLNMAYSGIINNMKPTDSISRYLSHKNPQYSTYFYYLDKIDQAYYELLFEQYPNSLHYLIEDNSELEREAVSRLIYRQTQELSNSWLNHNKTVTEAVSNHIKTHLNISNDTVSIYKIKKNDQKLLLMVKTSLVSQKDSEASKKAYLNALTQATEGIKDEFVKDIYVYVEVIDPETFFTDIWIKTPKQIDLAVDYPTVLPSILSGFYNVDAYKYYIKGSFSVLEAWYPKVDKSKSSL